MFRFSLKWKIEKVQARFWLDRLNNPGRPSHVHVNNAAQPISADFNQPRRRVSWTAATHKRSQAIENYEKWPLQITLDVAREFG
jgi:hypothetical protein